MTLSATVFKCHQIREDTEPSFPAQEINLKACTLKLTQIIWPLRDIEPGSSWLPVRHSAHCGCFPAKPQRQASDVCQTGKILWASD